MGLLRLTRPANVVTAVADILAGIAISGYFLLVGSSEWSWISIIALIASTKGLYAGGVVFNDVFDAELDAVERPERPIPSGVVTKTKAALWGLLLLAIGIGASIIVHRSLFSITVALAIAIAVCALVYDKWCKHHFIAGPLTMGLCRGLNLLLGISIIPGAVETHWVFGFIPIIYIAAITVVSRGEVHGGGKPALYFAAFLYSLVLITLLIISINNQQVIPAVFFILGFATMILPPLVKAIQKPVGPLIGKAVKSGVIGLILMDATWAAAFGLPYHALAIALLLPLSILLARLFAVT